MTSLVGDLLELAKIQAGLDAAPEPLDLVPLVEDALRMLGPHGLGLAIVKGIVQAHAGRISVESVEGEGRAFFVELLLAGEPRALGDPPPGITPPGAGADRPHCA